MLYRNKFWVIKIYLNHSPCHPVSCHVILSPSFYFLKALHQAVHQALTAISNLPLLAAL